MLEISILNNKLECEDVTKHIIAGIDEAGRGPVIGPMVIAYLEIEEENIKKLVRIGARDSKEITPSKRRVIFRHIIGMRARVIVAKIPPKIIDEWVNNKKSLNALEAYVISRILREYPTCADIIYIDAPSNVNSYTRYLKTFGVNKRLVIETKADKKWPIVAAASIVAKVIRDKEIDKIKRQIGIDIGSGYPSDPKTRKNLSLIIKRYPELVRKSWKTLKNIDRD